MDGTRLSISFDVPRGRLTDNMAHDVLRTSEMLDLKCIVFSRGKVPAQDIVDEADADGFVVLCTKETGFTTCGLLYEAGLRGVPVPVEWNTGGEA